LEQGAYDKLPADVYVKGFLKAFAEYLNADEKDLIRSFKKEKSIQKSIKGDNSKKNDYKKISLSNFSVNPRIISIVLITILFIGMSLYLYNKLDSFVSTPELVVLNPDENSVVYKSQILVSGRTDEGNEVFINNQPVLVDENGSFKENLILRSGINMITVRSVNRFDKEAIREVSVDARYEVKNPEEEDTAENQEDNQGQENTSTQEDSGNENSSESTDSDLQSDVNNTSEQDSSPVDNS
jgi:hypothetical protein